jgi:hypothetical protein
MIRIAFALLLTAGCVQPATNDNSPVPPRDSKLVETSHQVANSRRPSSEFLPSKHGFIFRNSFSGSPLPRQLRDIGFDKVVGDQAHYGKCGGMSLAAADYFLARKAIPTDKVPPADGSPLFEYITQRQVDSMGELGVMVTKFMEMMKAPDHGKDSAASLTEPNIAPLVTRLKGGELVPLGLVYVAVPTSTPAQPSAGTPASPAKPRGGKLWENHQVLAFGVNETDGGWDKGGSTSIKIYDSNFPLNDAVVIRITRINALNEPNQVSCEERVSDRRSIHVRGLFPMPYKPTVPK